jgi:hypothetical protein
MKDYALIFEDLLKKESLLPIGGGDWRKFPIFHPDAKPSNAQIAETRKFLHKELPDLTNGIYLYKDASDKVLYIGKAKPLYSRIYSHYRESFITVPGERKGVWDEFFANHSGQLTVFWMKINSERERHILEQMLEVVLGSVFEKDYPKGKRIVKNTK